MEKRKIILAILSTGLVLATIVLYLRVSQSASHQADPAALAAAETEYKRTAVVPPPQPAREVERKARLPAPPTIEPEEPEEPEGPSRRPAVNTRLGITDALTMPALTHSKELSATADDDAPYEVRRAEVNRLYDRGRYPEARKAALELLGERTDDRRLLRVVVSASCIMFEADVAREYYQKLEDRDKTTMRIRCERYGVDNLD